jgi:hypothetical protein
VLVAAGHRGVGPAHDLHDGAVGYAEDQTGNQQCSNRSNATG